MKKNPAFLNVYSKFIADYRFLNILLAIIFCFTKVSAQTDLSPSIQQEDSMKVLKPPPNSGLEDKVLYRADQISFSINSRKTHFTGKAVIEYQTMKLEAGRVTIDWNKNLMVAQAKVDSSDSLGNPIYGPLPVFSENGNEPITGNRLEYNFKTQRGRVLSGNTKMEPGFYKGRVIKKMGDETLLVRDGIFTTCDSIEHPHFYFKASEMRIRVRKRAVAKPIFLYIADIPVFAVPFGVFPMESGRRSGIIIPTFGSSSYGGNYLRNFGFYWAASQYWDATLLANFYERTGVAYEGELRYSKRYAFNGNVTGKFAPKDVTTGEKRTRWSMDFRHNQTLSQTMSLNASGSFVSDENFLRDISHNFQDRLNQVLRTDISFSKRWPSSKNSLTATVNRTENLQNKQLDYTLPRLSFSHTQSNLIPFRPSGGSKKKWFHDIYYDYNSNFISRGSRTRKVKLMDTDLDTVIYDTTFVRATQTAWEHRGGLSYNSKIFKYFKYRQSVQMQELWTPQYLDYHFVDSLNTAVADTVNEFKSRHTFSTNIGLSTTLYGLFELPFSPLKVIRHKMDPTVSFSFSPNFAEESWGYAQVFEDSLGRERTYDRFAGNPFGGTSSAESRRMNLSVANLFQGKMIKEGEEKKIDLFNLNFNTAYDFTRDSLNWSDMTTRMQAKASRDFDFTLSATHSFYKTGHRGSGRRDEFVWQDGFALPRLVRMQFSSRINLRPPQKKQQSETPVSQMPTEADAVPGEMTDYDITRDPLTDRLREFSLPWDMNVNLTYTMDRSNILNPRKRFDASVSGRMELTRNWRVQYSANWDILNREITHQTFNIYRDLHCWEMTFTWSPNKVYSFFNLEIRVKDSILRDLKLTKSSGSTRPF